MTPKKYEARPMAWQVGPANEPSFSELTTVVKIDDEGAGEFVTIEQHGRSDPAKITDGTWWVSGSHRGVADFEWKDGAWHHPSSRAHHAQGPVGVDLGVQFVHPFIGQPDPPSHALEALDKG